VRGRNALPLRVFVLWSSGKTAAAARELIREPGEDVAAVRVYGDDRLISAASRCTWMEAAVTDRVDVAAWNKKPQKSTAPISGIPRRTRHLRALIRMYHDAGMHVSVHSIGDRAIDWTVGSFEAALAAKPPRPPAWIIHANIPTDSAIITMARLEREYDAAYPEPSATFT
jgi:predicted amidohydrolase YtcJ